MSSSADRSHFAFASVGRCTKRSQSFSNSSDSGEDVVSHAEGRKTTGLDDDGVLFVGTEHELATYDESQNEKEKKTTAAKTPASKKSRTQKHPTKETRREQNWTFQYNRALAQCKKDKFASVVSGEPIYNWMNQAMVKVDKYDKEGVSPGMHDDECGSGSWKSQKIEKVRPLVQVFKERGDSCTATKKRCTKLSGPPHQMSPSFFNTAIVPNVDAKCKNPSNQDLYEELVKVADMRVSIGAIRRSRGHYQTGKDWCVVATKILNVSCAVTWLLAFSCFLYTYLHVCFSSYLFSVTHGY